MAYTFDSDPQQGEHDRVVKMPIEQTLSSLLNHCAAQIVANEPVTGLTGADISARFDQPMASIVTKPRDHLRILVATPYGDDGPGGIDRLNDLIFETIRNRPGINLTVERLVTRGTHGLFAAQFIFAYALARFAVKAVCGSVDMLHIHLSIRGSSHRKTVLGAAARLFRIPYIVHLHGCGFDEFWSETSDYLARSIARLFKNSAHCIVLGAFWARVIAERVPEVADRISVLPNATSPCRLEQEFAADGRVRITFLGQLGRRKGTPQLIEALGRLAGRHDWLATIAGDGDVDESRDRVSERGIADRTEIPGWLSSAATQQLLRRTDILVLPSFSENLPMVILEAFAHGIAVVSTPVGAVPEVIDHDRTGLLVPVNDVLALVVALERLINEPQLRNRLGSAAKRVHAERYEIEPYVTRLVAIWQQAFLSLKSCREHRD